MKDGLDIITLLSTGGDAATMALLWLVWQQRQTINRFAIRLVKLETMLAVKFGVNLEDIDK